MNVKTSKALVSALKGSAFRRVVFDGRSLFLRKIKTWSGANHSSKR